ncbi:hypothetical protein [Marinifilum caeruleilacunae]|uniref:Uncharacterized protein n=1 Tax=Marinifilum caeruleilacunae TaxID=2499076 RepID=A0ABX1WWS2_9BACT|nr:hypothetical protein [Marinifilum caeruleilacunae]NOU60569.1 hypothetical protein [Marinifilum caeruleilacunae]
MSEELSELRPKEEIYNNIRVEKWIEEIAGPGYFIKDLELNFTITKEKIGQKISYAIRFIKENSYTLIKEKKTDSLRLLKDAIYADIDKCNSIAFTDSLEEGKEGIYELWKHYLYDIEEKFRELESELNYLSAVEEINIFLMDENIDDEDVLIYYNYSKNKQKKKDGLNSKKINMSSIALLHFYNEDPIDKFNVDKILDRYGHQAANKLIAKYDLYSKSQTERYAFRDFEKRFKEMYEYLSQEGKKRALDDLDQFRLNKKNRF